MPWKVFPSGDQYCVHELKADGSKGERVACHATREKADNQLAALYSSEKGIGTSDFSEVAVCSKPQLARFSVKEVGGQLRWIAHYSNNVRDNDTPPEILSAEGHRKFVYLVDKGYVPYPELWIWHQPEWRIGRADWLAIDQKDNVVFALASGYFFEEAEEFGRSFAKMNDVAMSHGMYPSSIERDHADDSILTGWITGELTVLPREFAANKLTNYKAGEIQEESDMTVNANKRKQLQELWPGLGDQVLDLIESHNAETAQKAKEMGLETKESEEEETEEVTETEETETKEADAEETAQEEEETTEQKGVDVEMLAAALVAIDERLSTVEKAAASNEEVAEVLKALSERMEAVEEGVNEVKEADRTPLANQVASILANKTVVGKQETQVDGRTTLGKDAPKETKSEEENGLFFMPWVNGS